MSNSLIVSIGSNSNDRRWQIEQAIERLKAKFKNESVSGIYESSADNGKDAPYLNAVMAATTSMSMEETISYLKQWEVLCGRTPASKLEGVIPIDLDIVVWNNEIVRPAEFNKPYFARGYHQLIAAEKIDSLGY